MKWEHFRRLSWTKVKQSILSPTKGKAWDNYAVITPFVFKEKDRFLMFYTGQGYKNTSWSIGIAESYDLINWKKPLIRPFIQSVKDKSLSSIDGVTIIFNGKYYLYFESKHSSNISKKRIVKRLMPHRLYRHAVRVKRFINDALGISMAAKHARNRAIWFIESTDLYEWDIGKAEIAFAYSDTGWDCNGVFSPRVFRFDDNFYLLYGGSDGNKINTGIATSLDLMHWKRISPIPILKHGDKGDWDENHALIVDIVKLEDGYAGFYEGEDRNNRYGIGVTYSSDLINWKKHDANPILSPGLKGTFDEKIVCSPHIIEKDGQYYLFYSGHNRYMQGCCGLAISKENGRV